MSDVLHMFILWLPTCQSAPCSLGNSMWNSRCSREHITHGNSFVMKCFSFVPHEHYWVIMQAAPVEQAVWQVSRESAFCVFVLICPFEPTFLHSSSSLSIGKLTPWASLMGPLCFLKAFFWTWHLWVCTEKLNARGIRGARHRIHY